MTIMRWLQSKLRNDLSGMGGALLMMAFAAIAGWRWSHSERLFYAFLFFRDLLWSVFLLARVPAIKQGTIRQAALAYISTALPLFYAVPRVPVPTWMIMIADFGAVVGFLLATLATIELGTRVGVSPGLRGQECREGVYRWVRHPMYTGYVIAELGWVLLLPENVVLFIVSVLCYWARSRAERCVLTATRLKP
ncbi:isoprenylcysteine carboxylmethyltransferase family protein [Bdellovibrionota bacterium FG-1]